MTLKKKQKRFAIIGASVVAIVITFYVYQLVTGPALALKFNGNLRDDSFYFNDVSSFNFPTFTTGVDGGAIDFDGIKQVILVHPGINLDTYGAWTIETRVKVDSWSSSYLPIVVKGGELRENYGVYINRDGFVHSVFIDTEGNRHILNTPSGLIHLGEWHKIEVTYEPGYWAVFIDDQSVVQTKEVNKRPMTNDDTLKIGGDQSDDFSDITVDEVKLYMRAYPDGNVP